MKKLNNKGMTIIELTLSFIFVFTLAFSMYQLLFNYRVKQNEESIKAQMLDYKNQVTMAIQNDISEKRLKSIDYCTNGGKVVDRCLILYFNDGTTKQLAVEKGTKEYDGDEYEIDYITYGGIIYESADALLLEYRPNYMLYHTYETNNLEDDNVTIYRISIPIYHNDLEGNYGIEIVAIGYDYNYEETSEVVTGGTVQTPSSSLETAEGRTYNGYVTTTNQTINADSNNLSVVARVKFSKVSSFQQFFGNWQLGGSGLSLSSKTSTSNNKACFGAQVSNSNDYSSEYAEVCSSNTLTTGRFYTIVGTFDSSAKVMKIYVDGVERGSKSLAANSKIDRSQLAFAIGGNPGYVNNSNLFYGTISHAIVYNRTLPSSTISSCLASGVNTSCITSSGIPDSSRLIYENLTK